MQRPGKRCSLHEFSEPLEPARQERLYRSFLFPKDLRDLFHALALEEAEGNQTKAADRLKLQRTYLARLIKQQRMKEEPE